MSVPLDKLYCFLSSVVNDNVLIYHWSPHGSRNFEDIIGLQDTSFAESFIYPMMICHDQEPLDFCYSDKMSQKYLKENAKKNFTIINEEYCILPIHQDNSKQFRVINPGNFYDDILLLHSELHSSQVTLYEQNNYIPVYYWSHALLSRDWFRYAELDPALVNQPLDKIKYDFLIYNRAWSGTREYRLKFTELLVECNLPNHCLTSFAEFDMQLHYSDHEFFNKSFTIKNQHLHEYLPRNQTSPSASADYSAADYQQIGIEVVLETLFDDTRWHLTEKTLRPIACGCPFILVAPPGSLKYLQSYGFETFNGLIDETYDTIEDPLSRLHAVIQELNRIKSLQPQEKQQLWQSMRKISQRNQKHFFSKEFFNGCVSEYVSNFKQGIDLVRTRNTGKKFNSQFDLIKDTFKEFSDFIAFKEQEIVNLIAQSLSK